MKIEATSVKQYLDQLPSERKIALSKLRATILENLPEGFQETISYGMIGYVVPKSVYPNGYHCDPALPLPFISIASQKNFIAFYHIGMYADNALLNWFTEQYPSYCKTKLDMGKSCVRFKKPTEIPFALLAELVKKISVTDWITLYEKKIKK